MIKNRDGKYIRFIWTKLNTKKTSDYYLWTKDHQVRLGHISWFAAWRRYVYKSVPDIILDRDCLEEITLFLRDLMADYNGQGNEVEEDGI